MIVRAWGVILLNPFVTVCSTVTVDCCVCTRVSWVYLVCLLLYKEEELFAIIERRDMGLCEVPLSMSCFGMGTMLANFHMCGIMLLLRAIFNMLVRNARPRGPMCIKCLMFRALELLFLLCFIASWT